MRIRFWIQQQHFFYLQIRIPDPDPGFDDLKLKKIYSWKFNFYFLDQKLQFTCPQASIKYVQVTEEAFSSQNRPSNTSKHELLPIFFYFCGSFLPSWIWIRIPNTDPDPLARLNMDPIRIRNPARKQKKVNGFLYLSVVYSLLRSEGFSCSLDVIYGGLGISKLQFQIKKR